MSPIQGLIFDKDGTLFDFNGSWAGWAEGILDHLTGDDFELKKRAAGAIGFDLTANEFRSESIVIAGTASEIADALLPVLGGEKSALIDMIDEQAANTPQAEVEGIQSCLEALSGCTLGVVTNDSEAPARAHLEAAGLAPFFDFIAGYDSGYGFKPNPDPLLAFCKATDCPPEETIMVGDSRHDLIAGRAAGMRTVGVLTGVAVTEDLADLADVVLPDVTHLPEWIAEQGS